jgi:hypothetical protein
LNAEDDGGREGGREGGMMMMHCAIRDGLGVVDTDAMDVYIYMSTGRKFSIEVESSVLLFSSIPFRSGLVIRYVKSLRS